MWVVEGFWRCNSSSSLWLPLTRGYPIPTHSHTAEGSFPSANRFHFIPSCTKWHGEGRLCLGPSMAHLLPSCRAAPQRGLNHFCLASAPDGNSQQWGGQKCGVQLYWDSEWLGCPLHGWWQRPRPTSPKGGRGLQHIGRALPLSPSSNERQEQCASGSDWFAPVASLQAPRDSSAGIAVFLKGHL